MNPKPDAVAPIPDDLKDHYRKILTGNVAVVHTHHYKAAIERIAQAEQRAEKAEAERDAWKSLSVTAIAAENVNVSEYLIQLEYERGLYRRRAEKAEADLQSVEECLEAQFAKFEGCPHQPIMSEGMGICGCSYDQIGDVCVVHAPALKKAQAENTRLREALRILTKAADNAIDYIILRISEYGHLVTERVLRSYQRDRDELRMSIADARAALNPPAEKQTDKLK